MAGIIEAIKSTLAPGTENGSAPSQAEAVHTPDLSSAPGGFKEGDEAGASSATATDQSSLPSQPTTQGLGGGVLHAPHLSADRQDSMDAVSTTAVKNEPIHDTPTNGSNPGAAAADSLSQRSSGLPANEDESSGDGGMNPLVASKLRRDFAKYNDPESTFSLQRQGEAGAYDAQGRKVHEATDAQPGPFGVMGGAHLNSPDNRPETAGTTSAVPELEPDQGAQMQGILGPGPAMAQLPPTEPTSSAPTPTPRDGDPLDASAAATTTTATTTGSTTHAPPKSQLSKEITESTSSTPASDSAEPGTTTTKEENGQDADATLASKIGSQDPLLVLNPRPPYDAPDQTNHTDPPSGASVAASASDNSATKHKVSMGDKIKGLVTEIKGVVKKDAEIKEQGKAMRTGNA